MATLKKINYPIFTLFILLCFQNLEVLNIGMSLKAYHVFVFASLIIFISIVKTNKKHSVAYLFLFYVVSSSTVLYFFYELNTLIVNYLFCMLLLLISSSFTRFFPGDLLLTLRASAYVVLISVLTLLLLGWKEVQLAKAASALSGVRPDMKMLVFSGGINLEATWACMLTVIFIRSRKLYFILLITAIFITASYQSRAGLIVVFLSLLLWFYYHGFLNIKKIIILIFFMILIITFIIVNLENIPILERFVNIGNEPGSMGRLNIWSYIPEAFSNSPLFGYGAGNAINSIKDLGFTGAEDNVHNLYLQILLDFGVLGLVLYITMIFKLLRSDGLFEVKSFIVIYCILSFIEFRGGEAIIFFFFSLLNNSSCTARK